MSVSTESQAGLLSRRRFFRWVSALSAALGAGSLVASAETFSSPATSSDGEDYYAKLGVPTIINAAGTYTTLTAACMPPQVLAAVQKAALHPVRLHDLQQKAGEYIARRLNCEGAVVTSGAAGAISLATAACIQYANNASILGSERESVESYILRGFLKGTYFAPSAAQTAHSRQNAR